MKISFFDKIVKKKYTAIEYTNAEEGDHVFIGSEIELKNGEITISDTFLLKENNAKPNTLKGKEIILIINDDKILSRSVRSTESDEDSIAEAYPNLNMDDFYVEIHKTTQQSFVTVCRRSYVEEIIQTFTALDIKVKQIQLGGLNLAVLAKHIHEPVIEAYNVTAIIENNEITELKSSNSNKEAVYSIEGMYLSSAQALSFATLLNHITNEIDLTGNITEKNVSLQKEYKEKTFFKTSLQLGLGLLLLALTINFLIFNSNYKKWQSLKEELQVYTTQTQSIKKQQEIVVKKEAIVNSILNTGFSKSSWYADQIIQHLPATIELFVFNYQPLSKSIRPDKLIEVSKSTIEVSGGTIDKESFTLWLNTVEQLDFVDQVITQEYSEANANKASFSIIIKIKDESKE